MTCMVRLDVEEPGTFTGAPIVPRSKPLIADDGYLAACMSNLRRGTLSHKNTTMPTV